MNLKKLLRRTRAKLRAAKLPKKAHKLDCTFDDLPLQNLRPRCPYGAGCALLSDSLHQQNYEHPDIEIGVGRKKPNKYVFQEQVQKQKKLESKSTREQDRDEQAALEKEVNKRLNILAKRRQERLGADDIARTTHHKNTLHVEFSDSDDESSVEEANDGEDTIRSLKFASKKLESKAKIIIRSSPKMSPKERKKLLKDTKVESRSPPTMNAIVESTNLDDRTEEEKEHENKFILKRILKERDFMPRGGKQNESKPLFALSMGNSSSGIFQGQNFFSNLLAKVKANGERPTGRRNKFDEIRIAMKFWLNLSLRKSMNSWRAHTSRSKYIKQLMRASIEHWGMKRLRYGFERWHTYTRIVFNKKTYVVENGDVVTVLIRQCLFENPITTRTILSIIPERDTRGIPLMNIATGHISTNMDTTGKRERPGGIKPPLERQNAVKHMEEVIEKSSVSPIKYDMRTSTRCLFSHEQHRGDPGRSHALSYFDSASSVNDAYELSKRDQENSMALGEKEYMPVLRRLCEEYKIRMKKEQYKDAESSKTAKQILYGYMNEKDLKDVANIL